MSPVVVLVGPPGAGKSTVAATLAERLGVGVRDTDHDVETTTGASIQDLFVERGEQHFRALEAEAVRTALEEHDGVLALGGGAVLDPETRRRLVGHRVVFLDVGLTQSARRVGLGTNRPLLLGNVRATLKRLLDDRRPLYEEVATHTVATDDRSPVEVVETLLELLEDVR